MVTLLLLPWNSNLVGWFFLFKYMQFGVGKWACYVAFIFFFTDKAFVYFDGLCSMVWIYLLDLGFTWLEILGGPYGYCWKLKLFCGFLEDSLFNYLSLVGPFVLPSCCLGKMLELFAVVDVLLPRLAWGLGLLPLPCVNCEMDLYEVDSWLKF